MLTAVGNVAPVAIGALAAHYPLQVSQLHDDCYSLLLSC
jgi:hypothetical protein